MTITDNQEAQSVLASTFSAVPLDKQQEYFSLASAPIPKACFQVSQFVYHHRNDLPVEVVQAGRDLLEYCTYVGQWNGLPSGLGPEQLNYMDKVLGVEAMQGLDDAASPEIHQQSGVTVEEPAVEEPAVEEPAVEEPAP